jgi:hypothetical protein
MAETVYLDRLDDPGRKTVSTMGQQPGPIGGEGWSVVSELPTARLQANRHYAFWITGKIGNIVTSGATPVSGLIQLCLGDAAGLKSPVQLVQFGASDVLGENEGIPFAFLLIFSATPSVVDPVWGATWPNASPLQLFGRTWWRNDTPAYVCSFDVTDLSWVWADLDAIPGADQLVTVATAPLSLPAFPSFGAWQNLASSINTPGAAGQVWVHFWSVCYAPGVGSVPAFQAGYATGLGHAGFTPRNGTGARFGYGHRGTNVAGVQWHHGAFWVEPQVGAPYLPAFRGRERLTGSTSTQVRRWACLSLRLDNLEALHYSSSTNEPGLTDEFASGLFVGPRRFPLELIGADRSFVPWVFATGIPDVVPPSRRAFGIWINADDNLLVAYTEQHEQTDGPDEAIACYASGSQGLGPTSLGVQYQTRWLDRDWNGLHNAVRDIYFLTVFPVRDPDNVPPGIPGVGAPVEINPGKEALGVGSLLDPPLQPDVATGETINWKREELVGATGYRRTWGVFTKPRRSFVLSWGPVSTAQRDALVSFLQANQAFRITPPREGAKVPVVPIRDIAYAQESAQTWRLDLEVAELVYTGA